MFFWQWIYGQWRRPRWAFIYVLYCHWLHPTIAWRCSFHSTLCTTNDNDTTTATTTTTNLTRLCVSNLNVHYCYYSWLQIDACIAYKRPEPTKNARTVNSLENGFPNTGHRCLNCDSAIVQNIIIIIGWETRISTISKFVYDTTQCKLFHAELPSFRSSV